ncbi:MAG: DUF3429 domain-containing protein [Thalassospira sp.]|uniref:DUF3429 domain-containing protein n=1 Tax=Thalassospira sp. TaxID=1912094 RepID=UPI001B13F030|nr:DUF3429 domain-containing protein [Thalassospira sp.]MBO6581106.1 DUF3429 domain-containing protein [Thalassospira sp.]MBO6802791.1 DUF3429 domain-containing protein [Thalassospira sp.]MBO6820143.1 DUF3429 domain-containing protein [Thalassospira sp.]MBO6889789.1 DUF3429 domain-containing protein [Thalassospira sp.]
MPQQSSTDRNPPSASASPADAPFFAAIPLPARWFGLTGAIPFVALSIGGAFLSGAHQSLTYFTLVAYGAVILSFLGGVHWGRAIKAFDQGAVADKFLWVSLGISVVPSLIGWLTLLVPLAIGLPVLAASFAAMLLIDLQTVKSGQFPTWYGNLRVILSVIVIASLLFAWL